MPNKGFQPHLESQLIEVMKMKTLLIEFVSIVDLIQIKWTKVILNLTNILNSEF
jgi:hypothetical protein